MYEIKKDEIMTPECIENFSRKYAHLDHDDAHGVQKFSPADFKERWDKMNFREIFEDMSGLP